MNHNSAARRYDLDWLRVTALGLLIIYHIGMFYVTWGFHVKSTHMSGAFEPAMKLLNPWRLSLLFLISGMALRFAIGKLSLLSFTLQRSKRLLFPIIFGMLVIVPPQSWFELLEKGETTASFISFYLDYVSGSEKFTIIVPTWNHLWYVVYILTYTLVLIALMPLVLRLSLFKKLNDYFAASVPNRLSDKKLDVVLILLLPISLFYIHHYLLVPIYPSTHALVDDWANHFLYFSLFGFGFLMVKSTFFWHTVNRALKPSITIALILALASCCVWYFELIGNESYALVVIEFFSERLRKTAYAWAFIIAALALAQRYLNKPSSLLSYLNEAIFSWYIIHQTLIVIFGYWLTRQGLSLYSELVLLIASTYLGCFLLHEVLIRRINFLRPAFGMKLKK